MGSCEVSWVVSNFIKSSAPSVCLPALLDMLSPVIGSFPEATVVETGEIAMTFCRGLCPEIDAGTWFVIRKPLEGKVWIIFSLLLL